MRWGKNASSILVFNLERLYKKAFITYHNTASNEKYMRLQDEKGKLQNILMKHMKILLKLVKSANAANEHRKSWQLIKEKSSSKTSKQGAIKGSCKDKRLKKWYNRFKVGLLLSKKSLCCLLYWKPFKNDEKCFLFHLKSSFPSQDI